jgi:structure-specific recognition protein 1
MSKLSFQNITLTGFHQGSITFREDRVEWANKWNNNKEILANTINKIKWNVYGIRGYLKFYINNNDKDEIQKPQQFDGFSKSDFDSINNYILDLYKIKVDTSKAHSGGGNYGDVVFEGNSLLMKSVIIDKDNEEHLVPGWEMGLDNISLCVVPTSNRNEMEVQFKDNDNTESKEDTVAQITFHFPKNDEEESDEENSDDEEKEFKMTAAELMKSTILDSGILDSSGEKVIVEFTKDQGNFVTPRGKYSIQMTSTHMLMNGAQYFYKIKYEEINSLFLLPKPDGGRISFVISLDKPIRQGTQKYQHLVLETHKLDHTMSINLTEEEIAEKYDGQLATEMTMPMSSVIAKIFKVLSNTKVFVPKSSKGAGDSSGFISSRDNSCIRCSLKANEGLLYPLAKSFIFIHKPTLFIKFEDVESVDFKRMEAGNSATRNFDMTISVKSGSGHDGKDYTFSSIDKSEYNYMFDFLTAKNMNILTAKINIDSRGRVRDSGALSELLGNEDDADSDEDDDDYEGGKSSGSENDSDDSGSDNSGSDSDSDNNRKQSKKSSSSSKKRSVKEVEKKSSGKPSKKAKKVKDKNAPKRNLSGFFFFSGTQRKIIKEEHPEFAITDIARELGVRWKALTEEEKIPFQKQADEDKIRYTKEMADYKAKSKTQTDGNDSDDSDNKMNDKDNANDNDSD